MAQSRGVAPIVSTILMVAVAIILASTITVVVLEVGEQLNSADKHRVFADATVEQGAEYRSWDGGGNETHPDIDHIRLTYRTGPVFESDEIGSILIRWDGVDGESGQLRFVNPSRFTDSTDQQYHDEDVGEVCTGEISAGGELTVRMVHNEFQSGGQTDPDDTNPRTGEPFGVRYVESGSNGITVNGDPFFAVDGRYPVEYSGDRPIEPGDDIEILFLGDDDEFILARSEGVVGEFTGVPTELDPDTVGC